MKTKYLYANQSLIITLTRTLGIIFLCLILTTYSCSTTNTGFGKSTIDIKTDTTQSKQEIFRIRSLNNDIFDSAIFNGKENISIKYRLFKPKQEKTSINQLPLVVAFHGSGSIGNDNKSQLGILAKLFASSEIQAKYPSYILAPQFSTRSSDYVMDSNRNTLTSVPRSCLKSALQLIDSLRQNLNIDNTKIYAIGFSMGASTVINALSERPGLFAAGVSVSGIPQFDNIGELSKIPIWLIHGVEDTENPISSDEQFYKELSPNDKIKFWRLKQTTHDNVFSTQILGETIPKWLFNQQKNSNDRIKKKG